MEDEEVVKDKCLECDEELEITEMEEHPIQANKYICESCMGDKYCTCDLCCEVISIDESQYIENYRGGVSVCESCYDSNFTSCNDCGDVYHNSYTHEIGNSVVCESCYSDNYFVCEDCREVFHNDDYHSDGICVNCYRDNDVIHRHDYKPSPNFYPSFKKDTLFMGIELEVDTNEQDSDTESAVNDLLADVGYLKEDGSLDKGFEIVTHPCDINYHVNTFLWEKILDKLRRAGYKSHDTNTCGLHIHINRSFLSDSEKVKLGIFVNTNQGIMEVFARRKASRWAKFKNIKGKMKDASKNNESRYEALNWNNDYTIEFRMFKGTLIKNTLFATIQFVDAVSRFVKTVSTPIIADTKECKSWKLFLEYVNQNKKQYAYLVAYLNERGIN